MRSCRLVSYLGSPQARAVLERAKAQHAAILPEIFGLCGSTLRGPDQQPSVIFALLEDPSCQQAVLNSEGEGKR